MTDGVSSLLDPPGVPGESLNELAVDEVQRSARIVSDARRQHRSHLLDEEPVASFRGQITLELRPCDP